MEIQLTFADFAVTEVRFRKHFRLAPEETWNDQMVPLAEFLDLEEADREGRFPFVWSVDRHQKLCRLMVAQPLVESCEDRRNFWNMLRSIARVGEAQISQEDVEARIRRDLVGRIAAGFMRLAGDDLEQATVNLVQSDQMPAVGESESQAGAAPDNDEFMSPWIEYEAMYVVRRVHQIEPADIRVQSGRQSRHQGR